jgi:protein CpxP
MRKTLRLLTSAALFCGFLALIPIASAQKPAEKLQALSQQLQLTPEQKAKLLPVLEQEGPKIEAIKKDTSLPPMQKMKQLHAIHEQTAPELQKILSPAQYQKLQAIRQEEIKQAIQKKHAGG